MISLFKEFIRKIDRARPDTYRQMCSCPCFDFQLRLKSCNITMILYFVFNIASSALPVLWRFFELYPSPHSVTTKAREEISTLLQPLGLHKLRANTLVRFSGIYCTGQIFRYLLYCQIFRYLLYCCHICTQGFENRIGRLSMIGLYIHKSISCGW